MKKHIKKLLYSSLAAFVSISVNFNAEARLPKYMAQRAAELLIEKSGLQLKAGVTKEAFAANLVDFLYSTERRQHLANWMKYAYKEAPKDHFKKIISGKTLSFNAEYTGAICTELSNKLQLNKVANIDWTTTCKNSDFIIFVNQRFPCWTGTLTCFMLSGNSVANKALSEGKVVERCKESLSSTDAANKVVGILFTLELVDNWNDIKNICEKPEEPIPVLSLPYDPYDCVPVPNTVYVRSQVDSRMYYQGSCMISTIRNLLYMLCRITSNSTVIVTGNMKENIGGAFATSIYEIPGTTSLITLKEFSEKILPGITDQYQPTLELFVCTLNSLLRVNLQENIAIPTPQQYISGSLGIQQKVIENILKKITNHNGHLTVTLNNNPTKLSNDWPQSCLIINDLTVNKKITVAFGLRGIGHHVEIINVTSADH